MTAVATRMSLDEFLALPETEPPTEFACGRMIPKPMPTFNHAVLTSHLIAMLYNWLSGRALAVVVDNARFANPREERSYLPDVSVILATKVPADPAARQRGAIGLPPDLAIEVLSPDDRPGRVADKLAFYLRTGVPLTWLIDPDDRTVTAYRPGAVPTVHGAPEVIGAEPVLPGFELDLARLFSVLDFA